MHEEYGLISDAIAAVIDKTGGYIPSLVICTGDFVYGPTVEKERELNRYFPQIMAHLGGLDAVFVAGNHDSAAAASVMSSAAGLGADEALSANGGLLFDGDSAANLSHGRNSRSAKGIITYGIHFDAAIRNTAEGICYTYEDVIRDVESFLQKTAAQYHGELVVISAHSGLHVIGEQPESVSLYHLPLSAWLGENMYNVDCSYELAQTINRYAEQYDMDILYLFGHDHSRSEAEMFLTEGDTLFSTMHYADRSIGSQKLHFTYAHAGYLSSVIGCADRRFTFIYRDGSRFRYDLLHSDGSVEREEIFTAKNQYKAPVSEHTAALPVVTEASAASADAQTTTVTNMQTANPSSAPQSQTSAAVTAAGTVASAEKNAGVNTGEEQHLTMIAVPALFVLLLSRNRKKDPKA